MPPVKGPVVRKRNRRADIRFKSQEELFLGFIEDLNFPTRNVREFFQPLFEDNTFLHMYMPLLAQVTVWYLTKVNVDNNLIREAYNNTKILNYQKMSEELYKGFYSTCDSYYRYVSMMLPAN